jgi:4-hydroxybenzoate polyprenyltransferase
MSGAATPDALPGNWVDRYAPARTRPYLRLGRFDRPIGWWLLLLPGWWAIALAAPAHGWADPRLLALFLVGAIVMRAAGCVLNDIVDRDFDARVERTRARPLPSGQVTVKQALAWLAILCLAGLLVLLQLNLFSQALGAASLLLVAIYPFMKRITWWPQVFLGLAFNWGALLGWSAVRGELGLPALLLYAAGIAWTLGYDTIYAHQDKEDDALIGVRSTARLFGHHTRPWLFGFYAAAVLLIGWAGWTERLGLAFWVGLAAAAGHLAWQAATVAIDAPSDCLAKFRSNKWLGLILFASILFGR